MTKIPEWIDVVKCGAEFDLWEVLDDPIKLKRRWVVRCRCRCGTIRFVHALHLFRGMSRGCSSCRNAKRTHGACGTALYSAWRKLIDRCADKADHNYYGRGIAVCPQWINDFNSFAVWANANGWRRGLQIDRKDNDLGYSPGNCRVVTCRENNNNRRDNIVLTAWGETKTLSYWLEDSRCTVSRGRVYRRIKSGWDAESAMTSGSPYHSSDSRMFTGWGQTKSLFDWAGDARCVVSYGRLWTRLRRGWTLERALTEPKRK